MTNIKGIDDLDKLVDQLQSRIDEEEAMVYSQKALDEARHPSNLGPMENANATAHRVGTCGDTMEFFLKVDNNVLSEITYLTDGCGATVACGSMLTKKVKGMTLEEVMELRDADLIDWLDGLPEENLHCAKLAIGTLQGAVYAAKHTD